MKKILLAVVALAVAVLVSLYLLRPTAQVATVTGGEAIKQVPGSVVVKAEYEMELRSELGGRVVESALELGKVVQQGEVLVKLDTGDLELDIAHTESEYEAEKRRQEIGTPTKVDLDAARESLANYEALAKAGNYSLSALDQQRRNVKGLEQKLALEELGDRQKLEADETDLKAKRRKLGKMTLTAPFDGVVAQIHARPGDLVGPGASLATLISTSRTVEARISEENFADIEPGQKASVRFLGYGDHLYDAKVTKILPTADPETQRYIAWLEVKINPVKLVPGITGEVAIIVDERHADTIIPRRALFGEYVYVVEHGRVRQRHVQTGFLSMTAAEILKGLKPGEKVIVEQLDRFSDGDFVRTEREGD
ncbi:MAG TPA: efflux RND transporter periplasmic adaptor subunit [Opitutus sp.]|nr:efflux RND transporter periplasmic adaptor subunit [Opitutus sp.]